MRNALRYFPKELHAQLAEEFAQELRDYGRIYMYRFRPDYEMYARHIDEYPARSRQAAAIMMMIQNNLDPRVAQHPHELITYGGNGAVFQNWAQYLLTMQYLSEMTDEQTLVMYSGHPLGLFPSHPEAPRVVVTNGMVIPNHSKPDDWERMNALGVSQYGQMTAGSYMYIGPQGIVHGTTITVLNAGRKRLPEGRTDLGGMLFVSAGLGGMSGAQPKAGNIAGVVSIVAEINPKAAQKRYEQGWVDEVHTDLDKLLARAAEARREGKALSLAYQGNVVDLWERLAEENVPVDLGSDQTSLHNPWAGGYYPAGLTLEESNTMMAEDPERFREYVQESLRRQVAAINKLTERGMYFFDYGNAFLLEASRAGADIMNADGTFRYPSYVQDIMGPSFFDYGFGPFRWVCTSGKPEDLAKTDELAAKVLDDMAKEAPEEIRGQLLDNLPGSRKPDGSGQPGTYTLRRLRRPHTHSTGLQRRHSPRRNQRSGGAGSRPPRCVGHRLTLPRNLEHIRRLAVLCRHGRTQCNRRLVPRRHMGIAAQRRRCRLGRSNQRRFRHGNRRFVRGSRAHTPHAALGCQQRHCPPRLGAQRRRSLGHSTRNGAHSGPQGHTAQYR